MKLALVIFALSGAALATSIEWNRFPGIKNVNLDPINQPHDDIPELKIISGEEVVPHSIPYQVYLRMSGNKTSDWSCSGSLITTKYILTAAHCLDGAESARVTLGAHNLTETASGSEVVDSKTLIIHEEYDSAIVKNDIGLIELERAITLTKTIQLSRLPSISDVEIDLEGSNARVSGWGLTNPFIIISSDVLLQTNNSIVNSIQCKIFYGITNDDEICLSSDGGGSPCLGDSGGPLVIGDIQYGIISFGNRRCLDYTPSVHTRITSFLDWIHENSNWKES